MRTIIKGKQTEVTPAIRKYIEEKIVTPAENLLQNNDQDSPLLEVEVARATRHHRKGNVWWAEANLTLGKRVIRAEQGGEDPYAAIDMIENELLREIKSLKGRQKTKDIRTARRVKDVLRKPL